MLVPPGVSKYWFFQRKERQTNCETWRRLNYVLVLLWIFWQGVLCAGHNTISRLWRNSGAKPYTCFRKLCLQCRSWSFSNKTLNYSEVAFFEPLCDSYQTSIDRAKICSLEMAPFKKTRLNYLSAGAGVNVSLCFFCSNCLLTLCKKPFVLDRD